MIAGIILPAQWDNDGNPTRISIHTNDENEYIVDYSGAGTELLNLIQKHVAVKGNLRERLDGRILIQVKSYTIIDEPFEYNLLGHRQER
jgi:hypothetical protein